MKTLMIIKNTLSKCRLKVTNIFRLFLSLSIFLFIPTLCEAFENWPDTGQVSSYTNIFGEDSDYNINPPSYTKLSQGGGALSDSATFEDGWIMTRDNVTGLIWEIKTGDGLHNAGSSLNWFDWLGCEYFINTLNDQLFGGFSDWRIPSIKELSTIIDSEVYYPALNETFFPGIVREEFWSSSPNADFLGGLSWKVSFGKGYVGDEKTSSHLPVIAVRGAPIVSQAFVDNDDGTVTDTTTGLMWEKNTQGLLNWKSAINYCEELSLATHTDWRLPNRNELQSLVDYSKSSPSIDTTFFPDTASAFYWSSTSNSSARVGWGGWYVKFKYGDINVVSSGNYYVRAVRSTTTTRFNLAVSLLGNGLGSVVSFPDGIDCGSKCGETYNSGASVTLTATSGHNSIFSGWSGACSGMESCTIKMDQNHSVSALFVRPNIVPIYNLLLDQDP